MSRRICIGRITTAHGVRGLVCVQSYADDPDLLQSGPVYTSETGERTLSLSLKSSNGKGWLAEVDGVSDRTAAEGLRGVLLYCPRDRLPTLDDDDDFYHTDLIGLAAVDADGQTVGKVVAVHNYGASDLLEIYAPGRPALFLPFTKANVPDIRIAEGRLTVVVPVLAEAESDGGDASV